MLVRLKLFSSFLKNRVTGYKIPGGQLFFIQHHENITVLFLVFIIADEKSAISLFFLFEDHLHSCSPAALRFVSSIL